MAPLRSPGLLLCFILGILALTLGDCAPAEDFGGTWITNVGKLTLAQNSDRVTGTIEGYGGFRTETIDGGVSGTQAQFSTRFFGNITLLLDENTFKTPPDEVSFCGIRSILTSVLPDGCGFSGSWLLRASAYPPGSYAILRQSLDQVGGGVYDPATGRELDQISGVVSWGKGWAMAGNAGNLGAIRLSMTSYEDGFDLAVLNSPGLKQQCGIRKGLTLAYIFYYNCSP